MKIDVLVLEIGSTTTVVNAFNGVFDNKPKFIGQGFAKTSVDLGDVNIGIIDAITNLKFNLKTDSIESTEIFASSSAAGGLKMTVHGLVYDMTVKAAKEAALGAGANLKLVTAGKLTNSDIQKIIDIQPNIILIAGGVDYGERETALENARKISDLKLNIPIIYCGNRENHNEIKAIFDDYHDDLYITENVYPKIDVLHVEPTRRIIQNVFEKHIIHAIGMEQVKSLVNQNIVPTPRAVMLASQTLATLLGDILVFDVGGATTDVYSVTSGSEKISKILISPEPYAKRTVEGDLGVYVNRQNLVDLIGLDHLVKKLNYSKAEIDDVLNDYQPIPKGKQIALVESLTSEAISVALERHCGKYRFLYGSKGKQQIAEGKDLTSIKYVIGTGGALTRLPNKNKLLENLLVNHDPTLLMPQGKVDILIDSQYIMASLGVLSIKYPEQALKLLKESLGLRE